MLNFKWSTVGSPSTLLGNNREQNKEEHGCLICNGSGQISAWRVSCLRVQSARQNTCHFAMYTFYLCSKSWACQAGTYGLKGNAESIA